MVKVNFILVSVYLSVRHTPSQAQHMLTELHTVRTKEKLLSGRKKTNLFTKKISKPTWS